MNNVMSEKPLQGVGNYLDQEVGARSGSPGHYIMMPGQESSSNYTMQGAPVI